MEYKKTWTIIIIVIIILLVFWFLNNNSDEDKNNKNEVGVNKPVENLIRFDDKSQKWVDNFGVCNTCTEENGYTKDGFVIEKLDENRVYCFLNKREVNFEDNGINEGVTGNSFDFIELVVKNGEMTGNIESYPYGADSAFGTFSGYYDNILQSGIVWNFKSEGNDHNEKRILRFIDNWIQIAHVLNLDDENILDFSETIKGIDCGEFILEKKKNNFFDNLKSLSNESEGFYLGKKLSTVKNFVEKNNIDFRISQLDNEKFSLEENYVIGRVTAVVKNEIITSYVLETENGPKEFNIEKEIIGNNKINHKKPEITKNDYTGLSIDEARILAEKNGVKFRVVEKDGERFMLTMDYVVGRINAVVKNGVVVFYKVEGVK